MAIKVENKQIMIVLEDRSSGGNLYCYIHSLLNLIQGLESFDKVDTMDLYYTCDLIKQMLPSDNEFIKLYGDH